MTLQDVFSQFINDTFPPKFVLYLDQAGNQFSCPTQDIGKLDRTHKFLGYNSEIPELGRYSIPGFADLPVIIAK